MKKASGVWRELRNFMGQMRGSSAARTHPRRTGFLWTKPEGAPGTVVEITVQTTHLSNKDLVLTCSHARHLFPQVTAATLGDSEVIFPHISRAGRI